MTTTPTPHQIAAHLSPSSALLGYISGGLEVAEQTSSPPAEAWLSGLKAYADRASIAANTILKLATEMDKE
jgi:hypothetical protein